MNMEISIILLNWCYLASRYLDTVWYEIHSAVLLLLVGADIESMQSPYGSSVFEKASSRFVSFIYMCVPFQKMMAATLVKANYNSV